jgi:hypothetical protein
VRSTPSRSRSSGKISLSLGLAPFEWTASDGNTYRINLLDTPGYADFEGEVDAAMSVADLAVFVVSAVDGVEVSDRAAVAQGRAAATAAHGVRQQGGQGARRLPCRARPADRDVRLGVRTARTADRRGRRCTASPTC